MKNFLIFSTVFLLSGSIVASDKSGHNAFECRAIRRSLTANYVQSVEKSLANEACEPNFSLADDLKNAKDTMLNETLSAPSEGKFSTNDRGAFEKEFKQQYPNVSNLIEKYIN